MKNALAMIGAVACFSNHALTVTFNQIDHLDTSALSAWTAVHGGAVRTGETITSTGNTLWFTRSDLLLDNSRPFQIEAVLSADDLFPIDGERGARMWATFRDAALIPGEAYRVELRLFLEVGTHMLKLFDANSEVALLSLEKDWTQTDSRLRVRIKRQLVNGLDYVLLQAETSDTWDDPDMPNPLNTANSQACLLSGLTSAPFLSSEVGFGNVIPGCYSSDWTSVHVTTADSAAEILPYWPPAPPAPLLAYDTIGQGIDFDIDLLSLDYLANDAVTPFLDANGITLTKETIMNPSGGSGQHHFDFDSLDFGQTVAGWVTVEDISGRVRIGPPTAYDIPSGVQGRAIRSIPSASAVSVYPNPVGKHVEIRFSLASAMPVKLEIFNSLGQKIKNLVKERLEAGEHVSQWDCRRDAGQKAAAGVYLCRLQVGEKTFYGKFVLGR